MFLVTYHSRVAGVECGLEALLFSFSSSINTRGDKVTLSIM